MKRVCTIGLLLLGMILTSTAEAGRLYARRPGTEAPVYNLTISNIRTSVKIVNQLAVTHVDEEFYNDNNLTLEGFYAFQLPEGAKVDGLWLWVDGKRLIFSVKRKEEAQRLYDSVVIGVRRDPAILESLGSNRFQLKVFPINPRSSRRIELQYFMTLPLGTDGMVHYSYPLNNLNYQSIPVSQTSLTIDVQSHFAISEFQTNFDNRPLMNRVTRVNDRRYTISFGTENTNYTEDYLLAFRMEGMEEFFPVLTYATPNVPTEDPYFILWFPLQKGAQASGPRDYAFVLDGSGSMLGNRLAAVKETYKKLLPTLRPNDRFRIVLFASNAISFPTDTSLLFATPENIAAGLLYIEKNYEANGGTNYQAALQAGLSANFRSEADKRMIFLTDGEPTLGALTYQALLSVITQHDTSNVRLFPVLLYTTQITLLYDLAAARGGKATNIEQGDDLQTVISRLLFEMSLSGVIDVKVSYRNNNAYDLFPRTYQALVGTDQLISTGRFMFDGTEQVEIRYTDPQGNPASRIQNVMLSRANSSLIQVSRFWAAKKIDALLADIKTYGELPELKNSIIALSEKYMILTPYTAFLVLETNPIDVNAVDDLIAQGALAKEFTLYQNYPNPFSAMRGQSTTITFDVPHASGVKIVIYDLLGRVVRVLVDGAFTGGRNTITWDGRDTSGAIVQSGAYLCILTAGGLQKSISMTLAK